MKKVTIRVPATTANLGPGFDCFGVACEFVVVDCIFAAHLLRRQIGHNDICTCENAARATLGGNRA